MKTEKHLKTLIGIVINDKSEKSAMVKVVRKAKHKKYEKPVPVTKKYLVHDEGNVAKIGDQVTIVEGRPFSKRKRWQIFVKA